MKRCPNCNEEMPKEHDICWNCSFDLIDNKVIEHPEDKKKKALKPRKEINCLRCNTQLKFKSTRNLHSSINILSVAIDTAMDKNEFVDLYACPNCQKVEFYLTDLEL